MYFLSSWFFISFLQCSFQPDECKDNTEVRPNLPIGSTLQCFFNPEDTHQIVRIKASTESYNELLVSQVVWPLAIMMLGIVIIAAASCYYFSRNVNSYEELPGKSSATLLLTIWKIHQRMFTFCSRVIWHFILGLYECFKYLVWKFSRILKAQISRRTIFQPKATTKSLPWASILSPMETTDEGKENRNFRRRNGKRFFTDFLKNV